jgi:uracil-DNA glycosylase
MPAQAIFDPACRLCPRLSRFLGDVRVRYPDYHAAPVAPFGAAKPGLLIVGLAPGLHGANATGRPFTGDYAGILLYESLYKLGFSNRPQSISRQDGLQLKSCRITNAVKCVPPENKPTGEEINFCNKYLQNELSSLPQAAVILALGLVAHKAVLKALNLRQVSYPFGHGHQHELQAGRWLVDSYHCSRYNTQTGRLTEAMFMAVLKQARSLMPSG